MKKIMSLLIAVLFCICLTACTKEEKQNPADNPSLQIQSIAEIYDSGKLTWKNEEVKAERSSLGGLLIQGKNEDLSETRFVVDENYDFGSSCLQRIMVSGLGEEGMVTEVSVYLDGNKDPAAVITLPAAEENIMNSSVRNANAIVADQKIKGSHKVEFSVCSYSESGEKISGDTQVLLSEMQFVAESIPLINIRIDESQGTVADMNADPEHLTECYGEMDILTADGYTDVNGEAYKGGTFTLSSIRGRGNSTWKEGIRRPYRIKLEDAEDLIGMGENKNWALIANAYDYTLIHNAFTYKLGEKLGIAFTPQCVPVDVVMNGEYLGSYLLCENVRVDPERVAIDDLDKLDDGNLTGGYLLGATTAGADEDAYVIETEHGYTFTVNSPSDDEAPDYWDEMDYITEYLQRVENALYGEPDPVTGEVEDVFSLMDLDSAVRYYWIQELSGNRDFCVTSSTYCYKVRDGKLYWGPLWDFDLAWDKNEIMEDTLIGRISWFEHLFARDEFVEAVQTYYTDTLKPVMDEMLSENGYCETYYDAIRYSAYNNFAVWGISSETPLVLADWYSEEYISSLDHDQETIRTVFTDEHQEFMETVKHRVQWYAENLDDMKLETVKILFMVGDEVADTTTGYIGGLVPSMAEVPDVEGKRFTGWHYNGLDEEGNPAECTFIEFDLIDESMLEENDGEKCLILYADYVDRDESLVVRSVRFQQSSYHLYVNSEEFGMLNIPVFPEPFDGYDDEIAWSVDDPSVVSADYREKQICLFPMQEGTAVVSAVLTDGTVLSFTVEVTETSGNSEACAVTDYRLETETLTLAEGEYAMIGVESLAPEGYLNVTDLSCLEYVWAVESGDACSVSEDGIITAEHSGTAVVSCTHTVTGAVHNVTVEVTGN